MGQVLEWNYILTLIGFIRLLSNLLLFSWLVGKSILMATIFLAKRIFIIIYNTNQNEISNTFHDNNEPEV